MNPPCLRPAFFGDEKHDSAPYADTSADGGANSDNRIQVKVRGRLNLDAWHQIAQEERDAAWQDGYDQGLQHAGQLMETALWRYLSPPHGYGVGPIPPNHAAAAIELMLRAMGHGQ